MPSENNTPSAVKRQKTPYRGFSLRQRLLPSLLLALAAGFTVCFFGPFDIYANNTAEFRFALTDFLGWSLLFSLGISALITAILLPLRGRVFDIAYALFFWLTLMLFVQGNYLNIGLDSLTGDGVGDGGPDTVTIVINAVIWLLTGGAALFTILRIPQKHRDTLRLVCIIAMLTVFGMQTMTFAINSLATDVWSAKETEDPSADSLLTYENLDKVSSGKNIIYFVVDRFDASYFEKALEENPELFEGLDGFTYYNDMVSLYPRTYPSIPYLVTGIEHDFHDSRIDYFKQAYGNSPFLDKLKANNYSINVYTDTYYGYEDAEHLEKYVDNASSSKAFEVVETAGIAGDFLQISLFRYLPAFAKGWTGAISTADFEKYVVYNTEDPKYSTDMKEVHDFLDSHSLSARGDKNNFSFIHISGCHLPNIYDENFNELDPLDPDYTQKRNDVQSSILQSFQIINRYLDQLKELGLYEDATIIITGDHANIRYDSKFVPPHVTTLLFKESGRAHAPLKTSKAQVSQEDIFPSILASEGIEGASQFGRIVFEVGENEDRVRRYCFQIRHDGGNYEVVWADIRGNARDEDSWEIVSNGDYVGNIYN